VRVIVLYKSTDSAGRVTIGQNKPETGAEYTPFTRIVAGEGHTLTDGNNQYDIVDTYVPDDWTEVDKDTEARR
jgi:hypothetical protein